MIADREQFSSKVGFILTAAGSAVGIGNLVGFPVQAAKSGGALFLLIYVVFVVLICVPIMIAEISLGRSSKLNPVGAYRTLSGNSKLWNLGGALAVITPFMIAVFYQVITVWILGYLIIVISGDLDQLATPRYFATFINDGAIFIYMGLIIVILAAVLGKGVQAGIERFSKVLMPTLLVMLLGMIIFVLTLDNAFLGVSFYLVPDFSKISPTVISNALAHAFFSLSLGMGILITYGSYLNRKESIPRGSGMVALADSLVAFFAGLLILPAVFAFDPEIKGDELASSSITLIFTLLPKIFLALQEHIGYLGASFFAGVFFLSVLFAALTSQISILQVPLSAMQDELHWSRLKSLVILGIVGGLFALACTASFGMVKQLTDLVTYTGQAKSLFDVIADIFYETILPLNGFIICLFVVLKWKRESMNRELQIGDDSYLGSWLHRYIDIALGSFLPVILFLIFVNTVCIKFFGFSLI